jgi:hypothetical protein
VAREPLSPGARDFISLHIRSVRQLELLLMLRDRGDQRWTAATVAAALRVAPNWAARELEAMRATRLLSADGEADAAYSYSPSSSEDRFVAELADVYQRRKQTVIQAVLNEMGSDVQALSDAFRLRGPSDG